MYRSQPHPLAASAQRPPAALEGGGVGLVLLEQVFSELHLVVGGVPLPDARVLVVEHAALSVLVLPEDGKVFRKC